MIVSPPTVSVWIVRGTVLRPDLFGAGTRAYNVSSTCIALSARSAIAMHIAQHGDTSVIDSVVRGQRTDAILTEGEQ